MSGDAERLLAALGLAAAAILVVFWPHRGRRNWHRGLRHPALWVLISLAVSFAATALLRGRGVVALGILPFLGAVWSRESNPAAKPEPAPEPRAEPPPKVMSRAEAFAVFGLSPSTTIEEVEAAYRHMMWFAHPDHGGSPWLIEKLNEARKVLLKR